MDKEEIELTAYHEAGHAIVGYLVPGHDPVHKATIIPRGRALGVTFFLPEKDRHSYSRRYLEGKIASAFGGRIAEELIFGIDAVTNGAQQDIKMATNLARQMVTRWGFSDKLGPIAYSEDDDEVFLGRSVTRHKNVSDETTHIIDKEIRLFIDRNYELAEKLLTENMDKLHAMAQALIKFETLDAAQIDDIMAGKPPREPSDWSSQQDPPSSSEKDTDLGKDNDGKDSIGGPAEQH
jgi:cell division protease FtsH